MTKVAKVDYAPLWQRILWRFTRVFVSGGLAAVVTQLAITPNITTLAELKVWGISLAVGFIAGGLASLDKAYRG